MPHFSNHWPLKALYDIAQRSLIHAHIHTPTAVSTTQAESQLVRSRDSSTLEAEQMIIDIVINGTTPNIAVSKAQLCPLVVTDAPQSVSDSEGNGDSLHNTSHNHCTYVMCRETIWETYSWRIHTAVDKNMSLYNMFTRFHQPGSQV